jgi:hypothetical protein
MGEATWGTVLFLLQNLALAGHGRPQRFEPVDYPCLPFAQLPGWALVYQAAVARNPDFLVQSPEAIVRAITLLLAEHYSTEQLRRLPLSGVAAFLQSARYSARKTDASVAPPPNEGNAPSVSELVLQRYDL